MKLIWSVLLLCALGCSGGSPSTVVQDEDWSREPSSLSTSMTAASAEGAAGQDGPAGSADVVENDGQEPSSLSLNIDFGEGTTTIVVDHPGRGRILVVAQCIELAVGDHMLEGCDLTDAPRIVTDEQSTANLALAVDAFLAHSSRIETDCRVERCAVTVGDEQFIAMGREVVDLSGVDARVAPTLTMSSLELDSDSNTGTADVVGSGFAPNMPVNVVQCPRSDRGYGVDAEDCLYSYGALATADADGNFAVSVLTFPLFQRSDGEMIDCSSAPWNCALAEPWPDGGVRPAFATLDRADG